MLNNNICCSWLEFVTLRRQYNFDFIQIIYKILLALDNEYLK